MEDKSLGGACIRVKTPIGVGSKLSIQWRFEQFSGIAKYCRSEGREYLVGIQRDAAKSSVSSQAVPAEVPPQKSVRRRRLRAKFATKKLATKSRAGTGIAFRGSRFRAARTSRRFAGLNSQTNSLQRKLARKGNLWAANGLNWHTGALSRSASA
jgi:hypothetical protein